jgi:hypothetical protein
LLNVSDYTKGIYFYEVNGVSNKFIVEWMVEWKT